MSACLAPSGPGAAPADGFKAAVPAALLGSVWTTIQAGTREQKLRALMASRAPALLPELAQLARLSEPGEFVATAFGLLLPSTMPESDWRVVPEGSRAWRISVRWQEPVAPERVSFAAPVVVSLMTLAGAEEPRCDVDGVSQGATVRVSWKTAPSHATGLGAWLAHAAGQESPALPSSALASRDAGHDRLEVKLAAAARRWQLTRRQSDVLAQLCHGRSNKEAGTLLGCAEVTVEQHVTQLFRKAGVQGRTALLAALHRLEE